MSAARTSARGARKNVADMVRSLGIVLAIVVVLVVLHQPPRSDVRIVRVVDPTQDVRDFSAAAPGVPVPGQLPAGFRSTSSEYRAGDGRIRIGYLTPRGQYAEYDAEVGPSQPFLSDLTANAQPDGTVQAGGRAWTLLRGAAGAQTLAARFGTGTVLIGSLRDSAGLAELELLAAGLTPAGGRGVPAG